MNVAMHQPNFIPYLGFFEKIALVDVFVILDNVQYSKGDWHNRNIIKNAYGKCPVVIPANAHLHDKISEVRISKEYNSRAVWNSIKLNYCRATYYYLYKDMEQIFKEKHEYLFDLNYELIKYILRCLNINTKIVLSSSLSVDTDITKGTDLIIAICEMLNADVYLSGIGGMDYIDDNKFENHNIKLVFQKYCHPKYKQRFGDFLPFLSIIDLLFNMGDESKNILVTKGIEDYMRENR